MYSHNITPSQSIQAPDLFEAVLLKLRVVGKPDSQGNYTAFCPFHLDRQHPNLKVHPKKGYKCFACGAKGSIKRLAKELGIVTTNFEETSMENRVNTIAEAMELLRKRGLRDDTIAHFHIEAHLAKQAWRYPVVYKGEGRAYRCKAFPGRNGNKYWWSPRGETFPVYGLDDVKDTETVWLAEGEPDYWVMWQTGLSAITLLHGATTVKNEAVKLIKDADIKKVNICYDLDDEGKEGSQIAAQKLRAKGIEVSVRKLPDSLNGCKDLNDLYLELGCDDVKFREAVSRLPVVPLDKSPHGGTGLARNKSRPIGEFTYSAYFADLVDIVDHNGDLFYLLKDGSELRLVPSLERDGKLYKPPPRDQIPYLIPRWSEVQRAYRDDSQESLFQNLLGYHRQPSQLPSDNYYILIVAWDFSTYLLEAFNYSGYVYLYAVPERGKSKTGQAMIYVAYRGVYQENLREADLFRNSGDLQASLFLDVLDLSRKAQRQGSEDILLHRYEKGARVRRVLFPEQGAFRDSRYYSIFGATVIATNEPMSPIMETRSFLTTMLYSARNFPKPTPELGLPFRERLVAWRAHHMGEKLPTPKELTLGRLNDIATPLWQIIKLVSPSHLEGFEELIREQEEERRQTKASTIEAEVIKAVMDSKAKVEDGKLAVSKITDKVNESKPTYQQEASRFIGRVLKGLGFTKPRKHGSENCWLYNEELINRLAVEYGITEASTQSTQISPISLISPQIVNSQVQGDIGDNRDIKSEGVYSPAKSPWECSCYSVGVLRCAVPCNWAWSPDAKKGDLADWKRGNSEGS